MNKKEFKEQIHALKKTNAMQNVSIELLKRSLLNCRRNIILKESAVQEQQEALEQVEYAYACAQRDMEPKETVIEEQIEHINQLHDEVYRLKNVIADIKALSVLS